MLSSPALAADMAARTASGHPVLVVVLHERGTDSVARVVQSWKADSLQATVGNESAPAEVLLVVGPEGGISDQELEKFIQAGARVALLGHHVLRASTAGPAALVLVRHLLGQL